MPLIEFANKEIQNRNAAHADQVAQRRQEELSQYKLRQSYKAAAMLVVQPLIDEINTVRINQDKKPFEHFTTRAFVNAKGPHVIIWIDDDDIARIDLHFKGAAAATISISSRSSADKESMAGCDYKEIARSDLSSEGRASDCFYTTLANHLA